MDMWNWRVQTVVVALLAGALVGAALGAWLSRRLSISERVGRLNVAIAILAGCIGCAGLVSAVIVSR